MPIHHHFTAGELIRALGHKGGPMNRTDKLIVLAAIVIAVTLLFLLRVTLVGAAPLEGNRGGCGRGNVVTVQCEVSDSGPGYVSGNCAYGYWFSRVSTARSFRIGTAVTVRGCEGLGGELYAPIRISR